jgi:hypothetical protein
MGRQCSYCGLNLRSGKGFRVNGAAFCDQACRTGADRRSMRERELGLRCKMLIVVHQTERERMRA